MDRPRLFTHNPVIPENKPSTSLGLRFSFSKAFLLLIVIVAAAILVLQAYALISRAILVWPELNFAFNKPELVRSMRLTYEVKEATLKKSLVQTEQTAEEKLVNTVVKQLQQSK